MLQFSTYTYMYMYVHMLYFHMCVDGDRSLGMVIVSGKVRNKDGGTVEGIFIQKILAGSLTDKDGRYVGDMLLPLLCSPSLLHPTALCPLLSLSLNLHLYLSFPLHFSLSLTPYLPPCLLSSPLCLPLSFLIPSYCTFSSFPRIQAGDMLVEINEASMVGGTVELASKTLREAKDSVKYVT